MPSARRRSGARPVRVRPARERQLAGGVDRHDVDVGVRHFLTDDQHAHATRMPFGVLRTAGAPYTTLVTLAFPPGDHGPEEKAVLRATAHDYPAITSIRHR